MGNPERKSFFEEKIKPQLVLVGSALMTAVGVLAEKVSLIAIGLGGLWYANRKMKS
jgi:hypothetical protein